MQEVTMKQLRQETNGKSMAFQAQSPSIAGVWEASTHCAHMPSAHSLLCELNVAEDEAES